MSKSWTFKEKQGRGNDFLRFCKTTQFTVNGTSLQQLEDLYTTEYKTYRSQLHPGEELIPFGIVIQVLYTIGRLHKSQNNIFLGHAKPTGSGEVDRHARKPNSSAEINSKAEPPATPSSSSVNNTNYESVKNESESEKTHRPGRRRGNREWRMRRRQLAVDQHITFNKLATEDNEASSAQPPKSTQNYKYVRQTGNIFTCVPCAARCTSEAELRRHVDGRRHRLGVLTHELRIKRKELLTNKHNIEISMSNNGDDDGTVFFDLLEGVSKEMVITIKNTSQNYTRELLHCEMLKRIRVFQLDDHEKVTESKTSTYILPGTEYKIKVIAKAKHVGSFHAPLAFHFRKPEEKTDFHIIRFIHAKCRNQITEELKPTKKYKRPPRMAWKKNAKEIVPGLPLPRHLSDNLERQIELKPYQIEDTVRKIINRGFKETKGLPQAEVIEMTTLRSVLEKPLEMKSYVRRFSTLLFAEEIQMEVDIRKYDMENVTMGICPENRKLLVLQVPGLAENRPSVLKGDWLYVRMNKDGKLGDQEYQGFVHETRQDVVVLGFNDSLLKQFMPNIKFNVRFVFNRLPLRLQHRACDLADEESLDKLLFPKNIPNSNTAVESTGKLRFFNPLIDNNPEQATAIEHIVSGLSRPAPYIVFGPPGTGKTVTIVEAMKQIWKTEQNAHILACTPSNSAADLITQRLIQHIPKKQVLRLNAMCRSWSTVPDDIKDICNFDKMTGQYYFPKKEDLSQFPIIVCSLVTSGRISSANFPPGHFTHVFIDEAGHAVEPECLIAIAGILDIDLQPSGQLVLAGDPQQLGPILRSPFAIKYGLSMSLLERYMEQSLIYQRKPHPYPPYDTRVITKLLQNYRSHEAIIKLPNDVFYDGELKVFADKLMRNCLCDWEHLPKKGCPVIFHGVIGQDMREERSPSFFNPEEAAEVLNYVKLILEKRRGRNVKPSEIGIISPYRKQVQKIRGLLSKYPKWKDITVGSVEEFQGSERLVIIVSTVRSSPEYLSLDMNFKLGFLNNPKRFNVTLTRAKSLLIVIGNPNTLSLDEHWRRFIEYCNEIGCYAGAEYLPESDMLEDIIQRLQAVSLDKLPKDISAEGSENDEDYVEGEIEEYSVHNEQPWRADI